MNERMERLEEVITQMLRPIKGIPFDLVVKGLCGHSVIGIDRSNHQDIEVIKVLQKVALECGEMLRREPILRPRPNEVGNDIERYVKSALDRNKLKTASPRSKSGKAKSTGYPDLLFYDSSNRPFYLECKTFSAGTENTSLRSFFLSPSENFKVSMDARHLVMSFEMTREEISGSRNSSYTATAYKLVDIKELECDVKHEFNSDNKRLYSDSMILASGRLDVSE